VINKGAVIARLDLEPFQLSLDQARVQKEQADRTLERLRQLQGNAVSQVTVDDAETQAKLAELSVRNAERSLRDAQLIAPFDALVASRYVANFSSISPGVQIARLHDMSELRVEIDVPRNFRSKPVSSMRRPLRSGRLSRSLWVWHRLKILWFFRALLSRCLRASVVVSPSFKFPAPQ